MYITETFRKVKNEIIISRRGKKLKRQTWWLYFYSKIFNKNLLISNVLSFFLSFFEILIADKCVFKNYNKDVSCQKTKLSF